MADIKNQYRDESHIQQDDEIYKKIQDGVVDEESSKLAKWLREKMFGVDVRESLAIFVEWISVSFNAIKALFNNLSNRQDEIEDEFSDLNDEFKDVIANATTDSEVINARDSATFRTKYPVLDDRIEYIEKLLAQYMPTGFDVKISHNLGVNPATIVVENYQNALDTEENGFATSDQVFGSDVKNVPFTPIYDDYNNITLQLPLAYMLNGEITKSENYDGVWYLIDGINTLRFSLQK